MVRRTERGPGRRSMERGVSAARAGIATAARVRDDSLAAVHPLIGNSGSGVISPTG